MLFNIFCVSFFGCNFDFFFYSGCLEEEKRDYELFCVYKDYKIIINNIDIEFRSFF